MNFSSITFNFNLKTKQKSSYTFLKQNKSSMKNTQIFVRNTSIFNKSIKKGHQ